MMMVINQVLTVSVTRHNGLQTKRKRRAVFDIIPYRLNIDEARNEEMGDKQWEQFKISENNEIGQYMCKGRRIYLSRLRKDFKIWKKKADETDEIELNSNGSCKNYNCRICLIFMSFICLLNTINNQLS